jgi:Zn-dependent peptidase ImmA (M78 family)
MDKPTVLNPIVLLNTVGQEIEDILSAQEKDKIMFLNYMGWVGKELSSIKSLSNRDISRIVSFLGDECIASYLQNFQADYKETEDKANKACRESKKQYTKLKNASLLLYEEFTSGMDLLEDISNFFGVENEDEIIQKADNIVALYRISGFPVNQFNLYAWMRRGELDFAKLNLPIYDKHPFDKWVESKEWNEYLHDKDYYLSLPEKFKEFGVGLVFTRFLQKTVYGAVRWIDDRPLIQISDRDKSLAVCWFTLFHEIGHVLLHERDNIFEGEINETKAKTNKKEREANAYANRLIYNGDDLRKYMFTQRGNWVDNLFFDEMSDRFKVDKMFVAYWMKKAQVRNSSIIDYMPGINFEEESSTHILTD